TNPAKDGFGPEGRKKLKNAGVPTKPTAAAGLQLAAANPWPSAPGAIRKILPPPGVPTHVFVAPLGTTTVSGLPTLSPEAAALKAFCASSFGSVELMSTGRFKCKPRVHWYARLNFQEPASSRSMVRFAWCAYALTKFFESGRVKGRMGSGNPACR